MNYCNVILTDAYGLIVQNYLFYGEDHESVANSAKVKFLHLCAEYALGWADSSEEDRARCVDDGYATRHPDGGYIFMSWGEPNYIEDESLVDSDGCLIDNEGDAEVLN